MTLRLSLAAALMAGLACTSANAITDTVTINVSGTLTRPPCTMSSSKTLTANFGTLRYDQIDAAEMIDLPVTLTCPPNSSLSVSLKASALVTGSTTRAFAGRDYLAYSMYLKSDNSLLDLSGTKRSLTNQSGTVDLSMKIKLLAWGPVTEGTFSSSAVLSIEYL
ncbi:spore coat protein U domain-containing protein [Pseudomonas sp. 7P_10.2_Bac1]|uniref:fimbrial protein n=1 Tax=Pseudomonas sp. 7P_10.2_Bac1 TaxID=2971614 RepID=UPI0021C5E4FE|nr:spore coat protein U domain-containing protein [Pseudomonas sp. 7P_10.2_Bac1]MCU1729178.1 spore coat protein U domain-containing protein [Pseudomonas sp. 7P_10.2_Bac1]